MTPSLSATLNISRWLAAFLVVASHTRHLVLVDLNDVTNKTLFCKVLYFATGLGHESVVIFFVVSGFLVGGVTLDRWREEGPKVTSFVLSRVSRIYTVLVPALIVGLGLDFVGLHYLNASELYTNSAKYHTDSLNDVISAGINLPVFAGNLFMLQGILTGTLGSNNPLWSLSYEWWYYCLFALIGIAIPGNGQKRILCGLAVLAISVFLPGKILLWGLIWCLGVAAHAWHKSNAWRPNAVAGLLLFVLAMIVSRLSHNVDNVANHEPMYQEFLRDFILGIAYTVGLVGAGGMKINIPLSRTHERLAAFSYTTYLCHFPMMLFLVAFAYQVPGLQFRLQPGLGGLFYYVLLIAVVCAYCLVFSLLTERHTGYVRQKLQEYFSPLAAVARQG